MGFRLYNKGAALLKKQQDQLQWRNSASHPWQRFQCLKPLEPKGSKMEDCPELLLSFPEKENPKGSELGLARELFPSLHQGEVYLCDLVGCTLVNEKGRILGEVKGFSEIRIPQSSAQFLLEVGGINNFTLPFEWVDLTSAEGQKLFEVEGKLLAPEAEAWIAGEKPS